MPRDIVELRFEGHGTERGGMTSRREESAKDRLAGSEVRASLRMTAKPGLDGRRIRRPVVGRGQERAATCRKDSSDFRENITRTLDTVDEVERRGQGEGAAAT